ncbi:hypothetical protein AJ80_00995 [Polytolypa hystricis UAMH7299]|uniref:Uncharacterized protein n=1 Tax=Polytolypa hystricis (strain UAMH7299) TaxID=1447883 RepID=A0A2B7Z116_POLH7|nr:hypothetical protein AJ80_00995 [Polytolypa hystricis UAMH7299]
MPNEEGGTFLRPGPPATILSVAQRAAAIEQHLKGIDEAATSVSRAKQSPLRSHGKVQTTVGDQDTAPKKPARTTTRKKFPAHTSSPEASNPIGTTAGVPPSTASTEPHLTSSNSKLSDTSFLAKSALYCFASVKRIPETDPPAPASPPSLTPHSTNSAFALALRTFSNASTKPFNNHIGHSETASQKQFPSVSVAKSSSAPSPKCTSGAATSAISTLEINTQEDTMAQESNADGSVVMPRLEDLLRHPDDLEKITALKAEYTRKKAAVDAQLREGLRDQLETVQRCIGHLSEGQRHVSKTRDELQGIDKLCAESQTTVGDFSQIDKLARIQRNFEATIMMKKGLESFDNDITEIERLLAEDDQDLENQPNLLSAHMAITRLRDFRDEAMDQIRKAQDKSNESTLLEWFQRLDPVIDWFDEHLGMTCMNLIPLVQSDNRSMVVRLAVVVMNEEKNDAKVQALQEAQKDHKDLASRFKSMNIGPKTVRGYKDKFLKSIEFYAQNQLETSKETFLDDPDKLEKCFKWFFNDLFTVKEGMQPLMPKKWKIYKTYADIYHKMMHDWLINFVDDPELPASNMLSIIHWSEKYYTKMAKLGWKQSDLVPDVLDGREGELVRDWRNLIINALDEWIERMFNADKKNFLERDTDAIDTSPDGYFRTHTLGDMWRMIHEQIIAAGASQRTDVTEGVIDAMFRALKTRQSTWQTLIDDECAKYKTPTVEQSEGLQQLQDWLIALANDQIACIDDNDASGQMGYLTRFRRDFEPLVTPKYMATRANVELDALRDGYVDLSTHCISAFIDLIFSVDFRTTLPEFFTQKWYGEFAMKRVTSTFDDYITDYSAVLHPSLADILVEELSDELLVRYLSAIRNRGAKFRRQDPFTDKFKDDVLTAFAFFQKFPEAFAATIKDRWRLVDFLVRLLEAEKGAGVVAVYETFKMEYWDLQLSWVEAVLRSRDDFERSMVSAVKAKAAELSVERGTETIMGKVR